MTDECIKYYEKFFGTPYPFHKYAHVFWPKPSQGAMENVGCVSYSEWNLFLGSNPTEMLISQTHVRILHELSHSWFGNLVTMNWWDDLWLNESFATYMSFLAYKQFPGLKECRQLQRKFFRYKDIALDKDTTSTTHPVRSDCKHTDDAAEIFDGLTYGKGASILKQVVYRIGEESLREGMKIYF